MSVHTIVQLIHNPDAGTGKRSQEKLLNALAAEGWSCTYSSVKDNKWTIDPAARIIIIAGGDGTVRKVCTRLLDEGLEPVIALLPTGTSNNIAKTLQITGKLKTIIRGWQHGEANKICFDNGNFDNSSFKSFFVESAGVGLFPEMVKNIGNQKLRKNRTPSEKQEDSLKALYETSVAYNPQYCELWIDGKDYSGGYNLVEIMNISFVGPNVLMAPHASINDGLFDVVISRAEDKEKTIAYLYNKLLTGKDECPLQVIRGRRVHMRWSGEYYHVDDELVKVVPGSHTEINAMQNTFTFLHEERIADGNSRAYAHTTLIEPE